MRWLLVALGLLACVPADGPMMRPGSDCLACHSAGGSATPWTVAGTVYAAGAAVAGANVRITDSAGSTFGLRTNRAGNFYTAESVAFPLRVCVERGGAADCMESVVSQGSCNTCHGPGGAAAPANHPFPIEVTSKHAAIGCTQCHADMADPTNVATFQCASCHTARTPLLATNHTTHTSNPSLVVSEYSEGSDACLRCHADAQVYRTASHPSGFPGTPPHHGAQCTTCHDAYRADKPFGADFRASPDSWPIGSGHGCLHCHAAGPPGN